MSDSSKSPITPNSSTELLQSHQSDKSPSLTSLTLPPIVLTKEQTNILQINAASNIRRRVVRILLLLFRSHPHGLFESEISINSDLKYIITTHRSINITNTDRGPLYTLNPNQFVNELKQMTIDSEMMVMLHSGLIEHVYRVFNCFPSGIAVHCFDATFGQMIQFKLSDIIGHSWLQFVSSIPHIICCKVQGIHVFMNTYNVYRFRQFQSSQILTTIGSYKQLFESLDIELAHINNRHFEAAFLSKYQCKICCDSPYMQGILNELRNSNKSPFSQVFMGGFCHGTTIKDIHNALSALGFGVVRCTELKYRKYGFSWVTLSNASAADKLIQLSPITILDSKIDIRIYINREKQKQKPNNHRILKEIIKLLKEHKNGLLIRDIQLKLFQIFSHRISGSDLTEITKSNPKNLDIKIDVNGTEKILVSDYCHQR